MNVAFTLEELAALFDAAVLGDRYYRVTRAGGADGAAPGDLVFVETSGQARSCAEVGAAILAAPSLVLPEASDLQSSTGGAAQRLSLHGLVCPDPRLFFHAAHRLLLAHNDLAHNEQALPPAANAEGSHAATNSAGVWIAPDAVVHRTAKLGNGCVIQRGARVEAQAALFPGVVVERDALVGAGSIVRSRAVIGRNAIVGALSEIGSGSVIGAEPQQFVAADGVWTRKLEQTRVRLGERVTVGANTVIESGARRETLIESDVLIGGQVYIAHDCEIQRGVLIIGQSGLASGVCIERGAALMGRVAVNVDVRVGAGALVLATSGVVKDVPVGARVWGTPARSRKQALRRLRSATPKTKDG